jgi:hypothetical protein
MLVLLMAANMGLAAPQSEGEGPLATPGLDADKVDGFHAYATPVANSLLALDGAAKIPAAAIPNAFWSLTGNAGTNGTINFLGTTDKKPLELRVNNKRALRLETGSTPNLIGGYASNTVSNGAVGAAIGGGGAQSASNKVTDDFGTVSGGAKNQAGDDAGTTTNRTYATVSGGYINKATGSYSTVAGGTNNLAAGDYSFAAGRRAKVADVNDGSFLFADSSDFDFASAAVNEFAVRATGGARIVSAIDGTGAATAGVTLAAGAGAWSTLSDRNAKANFAAVDGRAVLERLAAIPVQSWNYKSQSAAIRHIGPTAQDFYAAFGVGEDAQRISTVDADGVALAAIQGLYQAAQEKDAQIAALQLQNAELEARLSALEQSAGLRPPASQFLMWVLLAGSALAVLGGFAMWRRRAA